MTNIYAALEIGTTRTVLAIGEAEAGGRLKVVCHAQIPSTGVRKSQILDINQATQSVRSVLRETERKQLAAGENLTIGNAFLVVSGQHIKADPFKGTVQVEGAKVGADDIDAVTRAARQMALPRDRELLDIVDQAYGLDNLGGIVQPKGMSGRILTLDTLQIHADANRINDARTAAGGAHLEPDFSADNSVNNTNNTNHTAQCKLLKGGTYEDLLAYSDGYLAHAGVLGVGGDHVTNDIAHAFQTTQTQAEELKLRDASAVIGVSGGEPRVKVPGSSPLMESRTISRRALDTVVNARLKEMLRIVRDRLEELDLLHRLHNGAVVTGGAAAMRGLDTLIQREFGMPVRVGTPLHVDGFANERNPESFAAVAGALLYAHRNYEEKSLFQSIFGGFLK